MNIQFDNNEDNKDFKKSIKNEEETFIGRIEKELKNLKDSN